MAIIDSTRRITWTPGIPGGVPVRSTVFATVTASPYNADNTGSTDAYTAIQDAIDDCPDNQVVYIPAGTYRLNTELSITKPIVIRGAGVGSTFLRSHANWHAIQIGSFPSTPVDTAVSGSPAKGATTITVSSVSTPSISANDYIVIDQINDNTEVTNVDAESRDSGTRCLSQITKVSNVSGSGPYTLTIDPPLYHAFAAAQTPEVWKLNQGGAMTTYAGVENLTLTRVQPQNQDGYSNFKFVCAAYCWLKNVESYDTVFWHVDLDRTFRCEVRDSLFYDGVYRTGGFAYGVVCGNRTTDALIENNRFYRCRHSMVVQGGPTGCVFGYNMSIDSDQGDGWLAGDMFPHGAHTTMNLFEGNCATKAQSDWTHGSSSYNTFYRNFIRCTSAYSTAGQGRRVVDMDLHSTYGNYVGNVLGSSGISWTAEETGSTRSNSSIYIWSFGFNSDGDTTRDSTEPADTVYRHGNYSARTDTVSWDAGNADHDVPSSLYLTERPDWFGVLPWPPYSSAGGSSAAITDIPAGYKYITGNYPTMGNILNSDGSASDTQSKITSAISGDTVLLPSGGSYTWTAQVQLPSTKAITLDLNNSTITLSGASGRITIQAHATGTNHVRNGNIVKSGSSFSDYNGPFEIRDARGSGPIAVESLDFSYSGVSAIADGTLISMNGEGPGVMWDCTFTGMDEAWEFIHIDAWGNSDTTGWTNDTGDSLAGSANIFYVEDCTFTGPTSGNTAWIQGYYGCRTVWRYNYLFNVGIDQHGTPGNIGARWWEIYENEFDNASASNQNYAINIRAGSGVIFNNIYTGDRSSSLVKIGLGEEDSGYPANYQPGRGLNQALDPARVWNNWRSPSLNACECIGSGGNGSVTLNTDVYESARPGYTAYTYPHPLRSGGASDTLITVGTLTVGTLTIG